MFLSTVMRFPPWTTNSSYQSIAMSWNPILISLNYVLEASGSNNLTKVILEALTIGEGMPKDQVVNKANEFWNR